MCVQLMSRVAIEVLEIDKSDPQCQCVLEPCLSCDLSDAGPCSACNGRGWLLWEDRTSE